MLLIGSRHLVATGAQLRNRWERAEDTAVLAAALSRKPGESISAERTHVGAIRLSAGALISARSETNVEDRVAETTFSLAKFARGASSATLRRGLVDAHTAVTCSAGTTEGTPRNKSFWAARARLGTVDRSTSLLSTERADQAALDDLRVALEGALFADKIAVAVSLHTSVEAHRSKSTLSVSSAYCIRSADSRAARRTRSVVTADDVVFLRDVASDSNSLNHAVGASLRNLSREAVLDCLKHDLLFGS